MGEVTAPTQELANAICSSTRIAVLHSAYPGQMATAGNFAIPLNPPETPTGPVCRFSVYHLMEVDLPADLFPDPLHGDLSMPDVPLRELAQVIRSKNAGPFELTFDIIFDRKSAYEEVKASGALTAEKLARLYGIPVEDILVAMFFDPAMAFKMTVRRRWGAGHQRRARHLRRPAARAAARHHDPVALERLKREAGAPRAG